MQYTIRHIGCLFFLILITLPGETAVSAGLSSGIHRLPSSVHRPPSVAGHRIEITNIEVIKLKAKSFQIYVDVVNSGRFDIKMGEGLRLPYLEVGFDESLDASGLTEHQDAIRKKLLSQSMRIRIGETKKRVFLKVKIEKKPLNAPVYSMTPPVNRNKTSDVARASGSGNKVSKPPIVPPSPKKKPAAKKSNEGGFSIPVFEKKSLDEIVAEKAECPDLIIESVRVVNINSKKAKVEYVLKNIGKGTAPLYDNSMKNDNPLGVRAYISGTPRLSKGAFPIDGSFITSGLGTIRGNLEPGESLRVTADLDIRRKTRYMPVLILAADAFLKLAECDRTNNTNSVILE